MKVIADTSAWYAFFVREDPFHQDSVEFIKLSPITVTPYTVVEELVSLLHSRQNKKIAFSAIKAIYERNDSTFKYIDEQDQKEIMEIYKKTPNYIDYVDASVICIVQKMDLPVFAFDMHYQKMGLDVVPEI